MAWTDRRGRLWLFGGHGRDAQGKEGELNDLWRFDPALGQWTWMKGSNKIDQAGVYGTRGVAAAGNAPGARWGAAAWTDDRGRFWMFGGKGYAKDTSQGNLNDLWLFDPDSGEWTWIKGADAVDAAGVYGAAQTVGPANTPGGRYNANLWADGEGRVWVFGGVGQDALGAAGHLNDLWVLMVGRNAADRQVWQRME